MAAERLFRLNAPRANPNVVAHSLTGSVDQGMSCEGLFTTGKILSAAAALLVAAVACAASDADEPHALALKPDSYEHYIEAFKNQDEELYPQHISNAQSWEFLRDNVPMFECPDKQIEEIYYFRWWTYRNWDYFCLDQVRYHGRWLTILYDKTGQRYGKGEGLRVFADGREIARSDSLARVLGPLPPTTADSTTGTAAGWTKHENSPVLGGDLGTCFDVTMLHEENTYRMWFSWRPKRSIALVESRDGIEWSAPQIVLGPSDQTDWEGNINRPGVLRRDGVYHMWYTGQARGRSWIGYATSPDGLRWQRRSSQPVLSAEAPWEKVAVMCPHVLWDAEKGLYRMWYSAGEQYEPNSIGYATSPDGLHWTRHQDNPVFAADPARPWEQHKVTACQVIPAAGSYLMFYIGFRDEHRAQIGLARSQDGITDWQRHPANPILFPTENAWDGDSCYKPFAIYDRQSGRWMLWYNGRKGNVEQIGLATHPGIDLGFPSP